MMRMRRIVVRLQEKPARDVPIAVIDKPAIRADQRIAVFAIDRREAIPGDARPAMMENVQVVEEKQQAEEIAVFDDGGALLMAFGISVLSIGSEPRHRRASVDESEIQQNRHAADDGRPEKNGGDTDAVHTPYPPPSQFVRPYQLPFLSKETQQHYGRTDGQTAEQGGVPPRQQPAGGAELLPGGLGKIGRFRIFDRIGQIFVAMMLQMAFLIDRIRQPQ